MYIGMSSGGVFESTRRRRADWRPLNRGCARGFSARSRTPEYGHDPHCVRLQSVAAGSALRSKITPASYRLDRPDEQLA